jgi:ketosteroid isomerase-like protein
MSKVESREGRLAIPLISNHQFMKWRIDMQNPTEAVLSQHLQAASESVEAVMAHYVDESVLITHDATYRGRAEIGRFFADLLDGATKGFLGAFQMKRKEISGELAYIVWEAKPWFAFATDTILVRDGKILFQTFAAQTASK